MSGGKLFDQLRLKTELITELVRLNLKIIFMNRFIYFLLAALLIFLLVTIISLADEGAYPTQASVYYLLLVPGLLLVFYPTAFGIQNDNDANILEILFGIPDYRYKVWLVRIAIIYLLVYIILSLFGALSYITLAPVPIFEMAFQLMFPVFFLGSLAFLLSTLLRSGNGTAAVMVILGLVFWMLSGVLVESEWNLFLNPYRIPREINEIVWRENILYNRIYLLNGAVLSLLGGLYRLQKREKLLA